MICIAPQLRQRVRCLLHSPRCITFPLFSLEPAPWREIKIATLMTSSVRHKINIRKRSAHTYERAWMHGGRNHDQAWMLAPMEAEKAAEPSSTQTRHLVEPMKAVTSDSEEDSELSAATFQSKPKEGNAPKALQ